MNNKEKCICDKCGKIYLCYDSPMLKDELWGKICPEENDYYIKYGLWKSFHVCLDCMEKELGRPITEDDLMLTENNQHFYWNFDFVLTNFPQHKFTFKRYN